MKKLKIAFVYATVAFGRHRKSFDFDDLEGGRDGLTGTDLVTLCYARELAGRGHEVTLYCHGVKDVESGDPEFDGVLVYDFEDWKEDGKAPWDVVIAASNPNALADANPAALRVVNRQVSTFGIDTHEYETHGYDKFVDLYLVPSECSKQYVSKDLPPEVRAKFRVLPNGCYPEKFDRDDSRPRVTRVPGRVAYTSSPDRGLHLLLQVWPEIRKRVPHAELRIFYQSLDTWIAAHCDPHKRFGGSLDYECTRRALYIRHALRRLEHHGVTRVGGVSHRQLVRELCEADCFAYPCSPLAFTETFSVATLEACAAGAVPVISSADCLEEVHGHAAVVVRYPVQDRLVEFANLVVRALTEPGFRREFSALGREHAKAHDWRVLAEKLEGMIEEGIVRKRAPAYVDVGVRHAHAAVSLESPHIDLVLTPYGSGTEPIDIERPFDSNSGGGCRAGFMGLVRELPKLGYRVRAFSTFAGIEPGREGYVGNVEYLDVRTFDPKAKRDVLLAYYDTSPLVGVTGCLRVASHHTFSIPCPGAFEWTELNLAPSQYAVDALRPVFDAKSTWAVMPNGLQPDLPPWRPVPGRCLFHTSPSRGLWHLLEMWPKIRRERPGATLHVVGDVFGWINAYSGNANRQGVVAERTRRALESLKARGPVGRDDAEGVSLLGRLSRAEMLREISEAACFPFPFDAVGPCETFAVCAMECLAVGVPVVMMAGDALGSIYAPVQKTGVWLTDSPKGVLDGTLELLGSGGLTHSEIGRRFAREFTFENKAAALNAAIRSSAVRLD